jgi:hypothetical protein
MEMKPEGQAKSWTVEQEDLFPLYPCFIDTVSRFFPFK